MQPDTIEEILRRHNLDQVDVYAENPIPTPEYMAAIALIRRARIIGYAGLQYRPLGGGYQFSVHCAENLNWKEENYRVDPALRPKKNRPWEKPEDVPAEAEWIKTKSGALFRIWTIETHGISPVADVICGWDLIKQEHFEWSDRERKVWHPCETEVRP